MGVAIVNETVLASFEVFWSAEPLGKLELAVKVWVATEREGLAGKVIEVVAPDAKLPLQE